MTLSKVIEIFRSEESYTTQWMVPYSTLMLILMIFFAALYGLSYMQSVEYEMAIAEMDTMNPNLKKEILLAKNMQKYIEDHQIIDIAEIKVSARYIRMNLKSPALFESGRAEMKTGILHLFEELSRQLTMVDNSLVIEGHTDNIPIHNKFFNSNWELSAARAFSVLYILIKKGIDPKRLAAHGFGEFRPAFPNDSEENRARNRRIEITIIRRGAQT